MSGYDVRVIRPVTHNGKTYGVGQDANLDVDRSVYSTLVRSGNVKPIVRSADNAKVGKQTNEKGVAKGDSSKD